MYRNSSEAYARKNKLYDIFLFTIFIIKIYCFFKLENNCLHFSENFADFNIKIGEIWEFQESFTKILLIKEMFDCLTYCIE